MRPQGPFKGLRWSGKPPPVGWLLHDTGRRLVAESLRGRHRTIWKHPQADVLYVAAGPSGKRIALSVYTGCHHRRKVCFVLYELTPHGAVRTVATTRHFRSLDDPVYMRHPYRGRIHLYWIDTGDTIDKLGRLDTAVKVDTPEGPRIVTMNLRNSEAPFQLSAYPGSPLFTLMLFNQSNTPTQGDVLKNLDYSGESPSSLTHWGSFEPRDLTDAYAGVAWVDPLRYVIPVVKFAYLRAIQLRLYQVGCEDLGYHLVRTGGVDYGGGPPWTMLSAGRGRQAVLVLTAADMQKVRRHETNTIPWSRVSLKTGRITPTKAMWTKLHHVTFWTMVAGAAPKPSVVGTHGGCGGTSWQWP